MGARLIHSCTTVLLTVLLGRSMASTQVLSCPWRLVPLVLLLAVMACAHLIVPMEDFSK
jgi:hypothetical protein